MFSASHTVREVERPLTFGNVQKLFGFIRNYRGQSSRSSVSSSESKASVSHAKGNVTSSNAEETKPVPVTTTQSSIDEKLCSSQTASFKVLVVEDNPINAKIVTALLRRAGIDFLEAVNGEEGVEVFKRELPAVVLLDINMPKMNGFDAAVAMRAHPSPYQHHIAAVTALSSEADRVRGFEAGMDAWYTKPMRMGRLIEEVQKLREAGHSPQTISSSSSPV
ncbi:hypothetical protein L7F22_044259 [Adiantum nelumboides]|nr:hypothetical protein [Adiantum nelumboides]